jgi:hypothetical protein
MKKITYSFYDTDGYSNDDLEKLALLFKKRGVLPAAGEFGGGGSASQIIAWLSIHWDDMVVNLIPAIVVKILNDLWSWNKCNDKRKQDTAPSVNISITVENKITSTQGYSLDKRYTEEEIKIFE